MFFAAICGQEVDCDCNPLQLCSFKLPASSLKAEYNALDILCDLIYQRLWFFFCHQGRLAGVGGEDLPTIVVVAHYDSFGVAPVCLLLLFFLQINLSKLTGNLAAEEIFCLQISVGFDTLF